MNVVEPTITPMSATASVLSWEEQEAFSFELSVFMETLHTKWTSTNVKDILSAAHQGRVRTLFTQIKSHLWGHHDPEDHSIVIHETKQDGDVCLLTEATVATLNYGGNVYSISEVSLPTNVQGPLAAIFRY